LVGDTPSPTNGCAESYQRFRRRQRTISAKSPKTSVLYPVVPIAESASGDIKIFTLEGMNFTTPSGPMTGLNVGLDVENNNGIVSISTDILGTTYDWPSEGGTAGFASGETMFAPSMPTTPPPSGTYDVTMRCTRGTGEPGEFETITIPNVRIVVP